ncbi:MAG: biotin/acetyl-CoA-carboxylase ligase [Gemmatimonadetes bacterium]|nr:biotin/acetyl-CoA-carboxylase ligase [Gemmatimonadota bacterium]
MSYDGVGAAEIARLTACPRVELFDEVGSTLDVVHALGAEGAEAGTLVIADAQSAGRGRQGRGWQSAPGAGIWLTLLERPASPEAVSVLSLRLGLRAAGVLDAFADSPVRLKWPNDLWLDREGGTRGKLAGILVEARWRDGRPDWIAIGFGLNVSPPPMSLPVAGLREGTRRVDVLAALVPALRSAALDIGPLRDDERDAWRARDLAFGRRLRQPIAGIARGIARDGALLVECGNDLRSAHAGSLIFEEDA